MATKPDPRRDSILDAAFKAFSQYGYQRTSMEEIASGTGLTKIETEAVVNGFIATIIDALLRGEKVELRGFGSFRPQRRAARVARNPRTKEIVEIDARYVPSFKASRDFRDAVDEALKASQDEG